MKNQDKLIDILDSYSSDNKATEESKKTNSERKKISKNKIKPLIKKFLNEKIELEEFKSRNDGLNKRHRLWGFAGTAGAMFFNLLKGAEDDENRLERNLRINIEEPKNLSEAVEKIRNFVGYVKKLRSQLEDKSSAPAVKSSVYFLSYFWHIQNPDKFAVFYPKTRKVLAGLGIFKETEEEKYGKLYSEFSKTIEKIHQLFKEKEEREFTYNEISNVFSWHHDQIELGRRKEIEERKEEEERDYTSYVPPIVQELPKIASSSKGMREKYGKNKLSSLLESKAHEVFRLLGFKVKELGQGKGANPDGIAKSEKKRYAIIYDTKVRKEKYKLGTDYREISDYVKKYSRALRERGYGDIYFMIISSEFREGGEIKSKLNNVRRNTAVEHVTFLKADHLIVLLGLKIKNPGTTLADIREIFRQGKIKEEEIEKVKPDLPEV